MLLRFSIPIVCLFLAALSGCRLISGRSDEVVLAPTEVGTPEGSAVTKDIGPAGGTFESVDGRLTLTVPQNALNETTTFSIQPIKNTLKTGLGLAYRLGPDGKTFTTPLELSLRYDDKDIEGSVAEAFTLSFQDKGGSWHVLTPERFDSANKTITVPITHFTDFAFITRFNLRPTQAIIHPKEHQVVELVIDCPQPGRFDKLLGKSDVCGSVSFDKFEWKLSGPGRMENLTSHPGVYYTAPDKKPPEGFALVSLTVALYVTDLKTLQAIRIERVVAAKIIIIDRGYRVSGQNSDMTYSGVICDLAKPFAITGTIAGSINYKFDFMPMSAAGGAFTMSGGGNLGAGVFKGHGSGTYTIEGLESENPRIVTAGSSSGTGTAYGKTATGSKSGEGDFKLIPLENTECGGG